MDLRFEAFNLIDRDPVLRSRLVTCATCLQYSGASDARASQDCFLVLAWTDGRPPNAPPGTEVLRADVHVPRCSPAGHQQLDMVLQRLEAALVDDVARRLIRARCVGTPHQVMEGDDDTLVKSSTFEIAPARSRLVRFGPWPSCACADPEFVDLVAASPRGPALN
jgi:hypothetical protein